MIEAYVADCVYCPMNEVTQSINICNDCVFYNGEGSNDGHRFISCLWDSCQQPVSTSPLIEESVE